MSREDTKDVLKTAAGVFLGKWAYDHQSEIVRGIIGLAFLVLVATAIGMLYWAATDFPAFWNFTTSAVAAIFSGIWWLISSICVWLWEKFTAMYLIVQIVIVAIVIYSSRRIIGALVSPLSGVFGPSFERKNAERRRARYQKSLVEADQARKDRESQRSTRIQRLIQLNSWCDAERYQYLSDIQSKYMADDINRYNSADYYVMNKADNEALERDDIEYLQQVFDKYNDVISPRPLTPNYLRSL